MRRHLGLLFLLGFGSLLHGQAHPAAGEALVPPVETIVSKMVAQGHWNDQSIQSFELLRLFHASNPRFKQKASREVRTIFHAPDTRESTILREEGSHLILQRVFDPILDAEKEA